VKTALVGAGAGRGVLRSSGRQVKPGTAFPVVEGLLSLVHMEHAAAYVNPIAESRICGNDCHRNGWTRQPNHRVRTLIRWR